MTTTDCPLGWRTLLGKLIFDVSRQSQCLLRQGPRWCVRISPNPRTLNPPEAANAPTMSPRDEGWIDYRKPPPNGCGHSRCVANTQSRSVFVQPGTIATTSTRQIAWPIGTVSLGFVDVQLGSHIQGMPAVAWLGVSGSGEADNSWWGPKRHPVDLSGCHAKVLWGWGWQRP